MRCERALTLNVPNIVFYFFIYSLLVEYLSLLRNSGLRLSLSNNFIFLIFYFYEHLCWEPELSCSEDDLKQVMEEYGTVESVKIIKDRETGKSKGFGFVEMPDDEAAKKAIAELNEAEYEGRQIVIKEARPK